MTPRDSPTPRRTDSERREADATDNQRNGRPGFGAAVPNELPPPDLYARVRAAMVEEDAQRETAQIHQRWWLGAIPLVAIAVLVGDAALRHLGLWRAGGLGGITFGVGLAAALTVWITLSALSGGDEGLGQSVSWLRFYALSVGAWSALVMFLVVRFGPAPNVAAVQALHPQGAPCLLIATLIGSSVLALLTRALLHSVPSGAAWRGAALGAAAGAWAGLALLVHCPAVDPQHLLVGHLLPIMLFPLLGGLLTYRFLRI